MDHMRAATRSAYRDMVAGPAVSPTKRAGFAFAQFVLLSSFDASFFQEFSCASIALR
jgi:hypothetical protein